MLSLHLRFVCKIKENVLGRCFNLYILNNSKANFVIKIWEIIHLVYTLKKHFI